MTTLKLHFNRSVYWLLIVALPGFSCSNYFKPVVAKNGSVEVKREVINANASAKYFILHQGTNSYALKNITVDTAAMTLKGALSNVDKVHLVYVNAAGREDFKYKKSGKKAYEMDVLNEVHLFTKGTSALDLTENFVLPLNQIEKIELIEHDVKRTNTNHIFVGVGITVGAGAVAAAIVAIVANSIDVGLKLGE